MHRRKASLLVRVSLAHPSMPSAAQVLSGSAECLSGTRWAVGRSRPEGATGGDEAWERRRNETNGKLRVSGWESCFLGMLSWGSTRTVKAFSVFLLLAELTGRSDNSVPEKPTQSDSAIHLSFTRVLARMYRHCPQLYRLLFVRD